MRVRKSEDSGQAKEDQCGELTRNFAEAEQQELCPWTVRCPQRPVDGLANSWPPAGQRRKPDTRKGRLGDHGLQGQVPATSRTGRVPGQLGRIKYQGTRGCVFPSPYMFCPLWTCSARPGSSAVTCSRPCSFAKATTVGKLSLSQVRT